MADDLDKAIRQIAQMFGVTPGSSGEPASAPAAESMVPEPAPMPQNLSSQMEMMDSLGLLSKARDMLDTFNHVSDNRINLIRSIQPFLGPNRQQRCSSCIQMLKIIAVISSLTPKQPPATR